MHECAHVVCITITCAYVYSICGYTCLQCLCTYALDKEERERERDRHIIDRGRGRERERESKR